MARLEKERISIEWQSQSSALHGALAPLRESSSGRRTRGTLGHSLNHPAQQYTATLLPTHPIKSQAWKLGEMSSVPCSAIYHMGKTDHVPHL